MKLAINYRLLNFLLLLLAIFPVYSQQNPDTTKVSIHVIAKVTDKTVVLRWAPDNSVAWHLCNKYGYQVIRYTMYKKNKKLNTPEIKSLTALPLKPIALKDWEPLAENNDFAAMAAEAIYGDTLQIEIDKPNINAIIEQSNNLEFKYSFALFSADQSFPVAEAMGLAYTDTYFSKDEIYIYKVFSNVPSNIATIDTGMVVVRAGEKSVLPPIDKVDPNVGDRVATLTWNNKYLTSYYTSYIIERSDDGGKTYYSLKKAPFINATNENELMKDWNVFRDSLPKNGYTYYYRIKGKSPFGDIGPASKPVSGMGLVDIVKPGEQKVTVINNQNVLVQWEYPDSLNALTKGFIVKSATVPNGPFYQINKTLIGFSKRDYLYLSAQSYNYITISAIRAADGKEYTTSPIVAMLVDSFPPAPPTGLKGTIDSTGTVLISWDKNKEDDMLGYRVYFANSPDDEFSQITKSAVKDATFTWKVPLNNLSNKIYFSVLAVDTHFNPSGMSAIAEVIKPDTIAPTCPVFKDVLTSDTAVYIEFYPSSSLDVKAHRIYRRCNDSTQRILLVSIPFSSANYRWYDKTAQPGITYEYAATAIDESGNESRLSPKFKTQRINSGRKESITIKGTTDKTAKTIILSWNKPQYPVYKYYIYRATGNEKLLVHQIKKGEENKFTDSGLTVNTLYKYKLSVEYTDGTVNYSNEIEVKY